MEERSNGVGMPGVGGATGGEGHATPPPQEEGGATEQEEEEGGAGREEEKEEDEKQQGGEETDTTLAPPPSPVAPASVAPTPSTLQVFGVKIMVACKLSVLFLALLVVVQSRGPLIRRPTSSQPFFPRHSLVSDFHTGDVESLTERLLAADLSLVMYYAPWDRDSQVLRWELEKAAHYHHEQVYFAAINCWQPGSDCRSRYRIRRFPAVVLHVRSSSGLETKALAYGGPHLAGHLTRFLTRCLRPLAHVANHADLARLQLHHNAVVLGFYDFTSGSHLPKGFTSYYLAALRALQQDFMGSMAWGVVTSPQVARVFSLNATQHIHLVLWNVTLAFTNAATSDSEGISNWVMKHIDNTASWLHLSGGKSQALSKVAQEGPTLMLFTPDNPFLTTNDPFTLLRELSLDYHNCNKSSRVTNLARYLGVSRLRSRRQLRKAEKACRSYLHDQLQMLHLSHQHMKFEGQCCQQGECGLCSPLPDRDGCPQDCLNPSAREEEANLLHHVNSLMTVLSDSCRELVLHYSPWDHHHHHPVCCHHDNTTTTTSTPHSIQPPQDKDWETAGGLVSGHRDDRVERLLAHAGEEQCKRLFQGSLLAPAALLKDHRTDQDITGLGCTTNKTLSFVAVDSLLHQDLAQRLGVNLTAQEPQNTAAVVVDLQREEHFILDASLSKHTLASFIINYTQGLLDRTLVSEGKPMTHCDTSQMCIQELTTEDYLVATQRVGQTVVVLHYNSNCVACSSIGHTFLAAAHMMQHLPNISFARFNARINTLPWHLHFDALPTIIVHPPYRKSDSRVFDLTHPITPASLLSFIMADLDPRHRLSLALHGCTDQCRERVVHEVALTTMALHHNITLTTTRLQRVLDRLVKVSLEVPRDALQSDPHYALLLHTKLQLVRDIKTQRRRLIHLKHMQKLLSGPLDKEVLDAMKVESFNYLIQKLGDPQDEPLPTPMIHEDL